MFCEKNVQVIKTLEPEEGYKQPGGNIYSQLLKHYLHTWWDT